MSKMLPSAEILEAVNGEEAVKIFERSSPDLVFMDMHMPVKNGCDATRDIRAIERKRGGHIPIVALTADVLPESRKECLQAGMDDFLPKPVEGKTLRTILERFLPL